MLPNFLPIAAVAVANGDATSLGMGTGNVAFSLDGAAPVAVSLNALGFATWISTPMLPAGSHSISATYSGDASYSASTASPFTFTVAQGTFDDFFVTPGANCSYAFSSTSPSPTAENCTFNAGDTLIVPVRLEAKSCLYPTGPVTVQLGSLTQAVTLSKASGIGPFGGTVSLGKAVFQNLAAGSYPLTASYAGDANFQSATASDYYVIPITVVATAPPGKLLPTTTTVVSNPSSLNYEAPSSPPQDITYTATVTGGDGSKVPPTGIVTVFADGKWQDIPALAPSGSNGSTASTQLTTTEGLDLGANQVIAIYSGDSVYQSSTSAPLTTTYAYEPGPDFRLAPQLPQITVKAGGSATVGVNLNSINGLNSAVSLSCAPSSSQISCSLDSATVAVNGQAGATLTITAAAQSATVVPAAARQRKPGWPVWPGTIAFAVLLLGVRTNNRARRSLLLVLFAFAAMTAISCGGGSTPPPPPPPPPQPTAPTPAIYSVLVTGTANGTIHNAKITVVVP